MGYGRRTRKILTNHQKVDLALERFGAVKSRGGPTPLQELARKHGRDPAVISKAIWSAFRQGLVEVRRRPGEPRRRADLEGRLEDSFGLLSAIVVEPTSRLSADPQKLSDEIHAELGEAMASAIAAGSIFRDGDIVGLGSGRGVYHAVKALGQFPPLRATNVTLGSLSGAVQARDHTQKINVMLDADTNVTVMGPCFRYKVNLNLISHPIAYQQQPELSLMRRRTWLDLSKTRPPTHALVGVGVLAPGHRFYDEAVAPVEHQVPLLDPIRELLKPLVHLCKTVDSFPAYCPVADISNHLFFVEPPDEVNLPKDKEASIRDAIAAINSHLLTATQQQLEAVNNIMLIAATVQKARAIRKLLDEDSGVRVRFLCIDSDTAEHIVSMI